jgi:hypothetical protein
MSDALKPGDRVRLTSANRPRRRSRAGIVYRVTILHRVKPAK